MCTKRPAPRKKLHVFVSLSFDHERRDHERRDHERKERLTYIRPAAKGLDVPGVRAYLIRLSYIICVRGYLIYAQGT